MSQRKATAVIDVGCGLGHPFRNAGACSNTGPCSILNLGASLQISHLPCVSIRAFPRSGIFFLTSIPVHPRPELCLAAAPVEPSLLAVLTLHTTGLKGQGAAGYSVGSWSISSKQGGREKEMQGVSQVWIFDT